MKNQFLSFTLLLLTLMSCSNKTYTALLTDNRQLKPNETSYYLAKNLLKLEIIYTVNEPRVEKNGIDLALTSSSTKITVENPISVTKLLVADETKTYVVTGKQLPESAFLNNGTNGVPHIEGKKFQIPATKIKAYNELPPASLTDSSIEAEAYNAVTELKENIPKITTKDEADMALKLVRFYKGQFKMLNEDFKPYLKKSKIKYTIVIDPLAVYSEEGRWSNFEVQIIYHTINPQSVFKDIGVLSQLINLQVTKPESPSGSPLLTLETAEGVVYREPSDVNFKLSVKDVFVEPQTISLAQCGEFKTISIKALEKGEETSLLLFKSKNLDNSLPFEEKIEKLDNDPTQTIEDSQITIRKEYETKLENINLLIKRLEERKAEL